MRDSTDRDLIILNAIAVNDRLTQRHLARELGGAVSLANLYVRRLVLKGFIRIINVRPNRLRYLPQSEILNRQGAKNAKTEMADWGEGTELLNAP